MNPHLWYRNFLIILKDYFKFKLSFQIYRSNIEEKCLNLINLPMAKDIIISMSSCCFLKSMIHSTFWMTTEALQDSITQIKQHDQKNITVMEHSSGLVKSIGFSAISAGLVTIFTTPFDVIRIQLQVSNSLSILMFQKPYGVQKLWFLQKR